MTTLSKKAAFFDVDETLINCKSMLEFNRFYFEQLEKNNYVFNEQYHSFLDFKTEFLEQSKRLNREIVNINYYKSFRGRSKTLVESIISQWWEIQLQNNDFWINESIELLHKFKKDGYLIYLVSGSFTELLRPLADHLEVDGIIATQLIIEGNKFTGEMHDRPCIADGKATRIKTLAELENIDLSKSNAIGDHPSDAEMIATTGDGFVINANTEMLALATKNNWQVIELNEGHSKEITINM